MRHAVGSFFRRAALPVLAALAALAFPSCRGAVERAARDIAIEGVGEVARLGSAGAAVTLRVRNDSPRNVRLDDACLELYLAGGRAAEWRLHEPVRVPDRTTLDCRTVWRLRSEDPMAYYALGRRLRNGEIDRIEVSARAVGHVGGLRVKFSRERMPLSDFLNTFGVTIEQIENFLE